MAEAAIEGKQELAMRDGALKCYREQAQQLTNELADKASQLEALSANNQALVPQQQQQQKQQQQQATQGSDSSFDAPGVGNSNHRDTIVELAKRMCKQLHAEHNSAAEMQQTIKQLQQQVASLQKLAGVNQRLKDRVSKPKAKPHRKNRLMVRAAKGSIKGWQGS